MPNKKTQTSLEFDLASLSISELRADFNGRVIASGDAEYDKARTVFYGGVDRHPGLRAGGRGPLYLFPVLNGLTAAKRPVE